MSCDHVPKAARGGQASTVTAAVLIVTGPAAYIGALAYLGPKAGRDVFSISGETADLIFGAVTVVTGVFGTLAGGIALDRLGSTMPNGLMVCALGMLVG